MHMHCVKVRSKRKQWAWWMLQDYIQSRCKDTIRSNFTLGNANLTKQVIRIINFITSLLEVKNTEFFRQRCVTLCCDSQSVEILPTSFMSWWYEHCQNSPDIESDTGVRTTIAKCEYRSDNTPLYTMGLCHEHRRLCRQIFQRFWDSHKCRNND